MHKTDEMALGHLDRKGRSILQFLHARDTSAVGSGKQRGIISSACLFILSSKPISNCRFKRIDVYVL